jgi:hypothetical protein
MTRSSIKKVICFIVAIQFVIFSLGIQPVYAEYDQKLNFQAAKNIAVGSDITGEIETPQSVDYYKFTTADSGIYTVGTSGSTDTFGALYDSNYNLIKKNDDGDPGSNNFSISQLLKANQTYYITVNNYLENGTGSYILRVTFSNILIQAYNENINDKSANISKAFRVFNFGDQPLNLSNFKIRYYYTMDSGYKQDFKCDWASFGESNATGRFVKMEKAASGSDCYLEIGFGTGAGNIDAGDYIEFKTSVIKPDGSLYTQIGDYSYNPSAFDFTNWYNVTGYISGVLKWGREPGQISDREILLYDNVDAGNIDDEKMHNLIASSSTAGEDEKYTVRNIKGIDGASFSYDLSVPAGLESLELYIREIYSQPLTREYDIYIDGKLLKHYSQTSAYTAVYSIKATELSAITNDGKLTIKFTGRNSAQNYGPSIADIWVMPATL